MTSATYKDAGVDLDVYRDAMRRLPRLMHRTYSPRVLKLDGGFAGLFRVDFASPLFARNYSEPILVAGTDGVGTKLKVAQRCGTHDTVGIDLVAMCVNDVICCGAEPLFFLDYIAMSHDGPALLEQIVTGVSNGCLEADCALLGGETAIMPDLYARGDYDLAGFCVGIVEEKHLIDGSTISAGDVVLGVQSSGLHSNGFSLVRKIVFDVARLEVDRYVDELEMPVGSALMVPTRIYARALRRILGHYKVKNVVHGVAHITGGGIRENVERILPDSVQVVIDRHCWQVPPIFQWLKRLGGVADEEMQRVFNLGIGLVLVVSAYYAEPIRRMMVASGFECQPIGEVVRGKGDVVLVS